MKCKFIIAKYSLYIVKWGMDSYFLFILFYMYMYGIFCQRKRMEYYGFCLD